MNSSLNTSLKQTQTTRLSPTQIQMIRLLELPSVDLCQRINEELENNFALEEGPEPLTQEQRDQQEEMAEYEQIGGNDDSRDDMGYGDNDSDDDNMGYSISPRGNTEIQHTNYSGGTSLYEHLKSQVYLTPMTKPERHIAKWVLGNIDSNGYLRRTTEQLVDDLAFREGIEISDEEMAKIVGYIRTFDPIGIAASDLQDCLILQLQSYPQTKEVSNALRVIKLCFDDFTKRHFAKICERLEMSKEELTAAVEIITKLNRNPAGAFSSEGNDAERLQTIIPDFYISRMGERLTITLNTGNIPTLHVSTDYLNMLRDGVGDKDTQRMIKLKTDEATAFIDSIRQRNTTLTKTMEAILAFQHEFFSEGDETAIRPMNLQDIAHITGYDISTISRVTNSKYVQTEFGIFPLKLFFVESMTDDSGDEISNLEIKKILSSLISEEDKSAPLTDDALVAALKQAGYTVARRTVTKYRDAMGIPVARLRKTI